MARPQFIFLIIISIGLGMAAAFVLPPACNDPVGCSWLTPGASLFIGVQRVSSGPDRLRSQAVLQGAAMDPDQAIFSGHPLELYPVDVSCLPGNPDPSAAAIAGNRAVIAAVGPACDLDAERFSQAMRAAGKPLLDPIPGVDAGGIARQAAALLARLNAGRNLFVFSLTDQDQEIAGLLCQELENSGQACAGLGSLETPPDALLIIGLIDSIREMPVLAEDFSGKPVIVLSLSRPEMPEPASTFLWLGPGAWKQAWQTGPGAQSASLPSSILELVSAEAVQVIQNALRITGQSQWDGSLLVPTQALTRQIEAEKKASQFFSATSIFGSENPIFSLTAFQVQGIEYNDLVD